MSKIPYLSIIIPCYNSEDTLEDAVNSCFDQDLENFEIVIVNDFSIDNTKNLINELVLKHNEIRAFYHEVNRGGGATRNTAVYNSLSNVIFCLDSDDILPPNTLSKMLSYLHEKKSDGVGINRSIKFNGENVDDVERIDTFGYVGEKIPFESLIQKNGILCPLYSTFMHTKDAFEKVGGYPTNHGFDTQGYAWRFLAAGLVCYTCPDASYLHRMNYKESYYMREDKAGKINYNWQNIFLEHLHLFSEDTQKFILSFDCKDIHRNLFDEVRKREVVFKKNYKDLLGQNNNKEFPITLNRKYIKRTSLTGIILRIKNKVIKKFTLIITIAKGREGRISLIFAFLILKLRKLLKISFNALVPSIDKIDVVIPTISKDYSLLKEVVESVRTNLFHPIGNIYLISNNNLEIKSFCEKEKCVFIDEAELLGYGKENINYTINGLDRSGWIFQQLLKYSAAKIINLNNYLVVDSDTVFVSPHIFIKNKKYVFLQSEEWHAPYFKAFKRLFGFECKNFLSYTSHMMIFNKKRLDEMKKEIEMIHKKSWDQAYLSVLDMNEPSSVSDYDTYANWMKIRHKDECEFLPFYNKSLSKNFLLPLNKLIQKYGKNYKSLSFHNYLS